MHVVDVGVHGIFQGHPPVDCPVGDTVEHLALLFKELLWNVLFDGGRFAFAHPDEDHAFQGLSGVFTGLDLAGDAGVGSFAQDRDALAGAVEHPTMVGTGNRALEVAIALRQTGAPVGAYVPEGCHGAISITEEAQLFAQHL